MTGMLASVTSVQEAEIIMGFDIDIIDIKNPVDGALGAQPVSLVQTIVEFVNGHRLTSATIGDIAPSDRNLLNSIMKMAETNVDIVKVGLFSDRVEQSFLNSIKHAVDNEVSIVVVLFAEDYQKERVLIPLLDIGLKGVMIDTRLKNNSGLCDLLDHEELNSFVAHSRSNDLLSGLAGSLRSENIPSLLEYYPDYLGFRGALCEGNKREQVLSIAAIQDVYRQVKKDTNLAQNNTQIFRQAI